MSVKVESDWSVEYRDDRVRFKFGRNRANAENVELDVGILGKSGTASALTSIPIEEIRHFCEEVLRYTRP